MDRGVFLWLFYSWVYVAKLEKGCVAQQTTKKICLN